MFDKFKGMYDFQKKAKLIQKELKHTYFEASTPSGSVSAKVNGAQELTDLTFGTDPNIFNDPHKLSKQIVDVINKAISKSQKASAEQMKTIMGGLNLPGF